MVKIQVLYVILLTLITLLNGCDSDERVVRIATEAADRQAEQNHELVQLNREVAEGTRRLVEADAMGVFRWVLRWALRSASASSGLNR